MLLTCYPNLDTPNSINVALGIGHWQLGIGHLGIRTPCHVLLEWPPNNSFPMRNCQCPKPCTELGTWFNKGCFSNNVPGITNLVSRAFPFWIGLERGCGITCPARGMWISGDIHITTTTTTTTTIVVQYCIPISSQYMSGMQNSNYGPSMWNRPISIY